jgi:hypothetical protein
VGTAGPGLLLYGYNPAEASLGLAPVGSVHDVFVMGDAEVLEGLEEGVGPGVELRTGTGINLIEEN